MQTSLRYQYPQSNQRPIRYTLSGNLRQKYQQIPQFQQVLRTTQKCPFTQIRQLIVVFQRNDQFTTDITLCDILQQKYEQNAKLVGMDTKLNTSITQLQTSLTRLNKLNQCLQQYNTIYDDLRKPLQRPQQKMLPNQNKYQYQTRIASKINYNRLSKQNQYFQYLTYSQQFQRALVLASASQSHLLKTQIINKQAMNYLTNFRILNDYLNKLINNFQGYLKDFNGMIFQWRQLVKHGKSTQLFSNKCNQQIQEWNKKMLQAETFYTQMTFFSNWLQKDREQMRRVYQSNSKDYFNFLPSYTKTKQIYQISSRNSTYREIIKQQKNLLENHLRKNYGMIVPYSPSPQFTTAVAPLQTPKNYQLKALIAQQLTPLEDGILYINTQYQKIYKQVCDNYGVRRKIQDYIRKFTQYTKLPQQNNDFAVHLLESCQKLLRIAK